MKNLRPGMNIRVKPEWRNVHPETPLIGIRLRVADPGVHIEPGEIAILHNGELWYVPQEYIEEEQPQ